MSHLRCFVSGEGAPPPPPPPTWEAGWSLSRGIAKGEETGGASARGGKINVLMENRMSVRN